MGEFTPQKVPKKIISSEDQLMLFCYKFSRYTFAQARKMPYTRILKMLKAARKEDARRMFEITQIVAAPHSKKGELIKKMLEYYKDIMED